MRIFNYMKQIITLSSIIITMYSCQTQSKKTITTIKDDESAFIVEGEMNLKDLAKISSQLTSEVYLYNENQLGRIIFSKKTELSKENIVEIFTSALYDNGFSRVPMKEAHYYRILRARDARDQALESFSANKTLKPNFPRYYDMGTMTYHFETKGIAEIVAMKMRSILPANSRVVPTNDSTLMITDTIANFSSLYDKIMNHDNTESLKVARVFKKREQTSKPQENTDKK